MKKFSNLFGIIIFSITIVLSFSACVDRDSGAENEPPVPRELWGLWERVGTPDDPHIMRFSAHRYISYDDDGEPVSYAARGDGGQRVQNWVVVTWVLLCDSYTITNNGDTIEFGLGGYFNGSTYNRRPE